MKKEAISERVAEWMCVVGVILISLYIGPVCAGERPEDVSEPEVVEERAPEPARWKFKRAPLPQCKSFLITQLGLGNESNGGTLISVDLGYMANMSERYAIGGSFLFGGVRDGPDEGGCYGLSFRYCRWLTKEVSLDLSSGVLRKALNPLERRHVVWKAVEGIGLNLNGWVTLKGMVELGSSNPVFYTGVSVG